MTKRSTRRPRGKMLMLAVINRIIRNPGKYNQTQWNENGCRCVGALCELVGGKTPKESMAHRLGVGDDYAWNNFFSYYLEFPTIYRNARKFIGPNLAKRMLPLSMYKANLEKAK